MCWFNVRIFAVMSCVYEDPRQHSTISRKQALIYPTSLTKPNSPPKQTYSCTQLIVQRVEANYAEPWRTRTQSSSSGTGFLVSGHRIITNAHVVHRATSVIVQAQAGAPAKYAAKVVCIGREIDLAILKVEDESFWANKTELEVRRDRCSCCAIPSRPARIYALTSLSHLIALSHARCVRRGSCPMFFRSSTIT